MLRSSYTWGPLSVTTPERRACFLPSRAQASTWVSRPAQAALEAPIYGIVISPLLTTRPAIPKGQGSAQSRVPPTASVPSPQSRDRPTSAPQYQDPSLGQAFLVWARYLGRQGGGGEGVLPIREAKLFTVAWERIAGPWFYILPPRSRSRKNSSGVGHTPVPARQIGPAASD